MSAAVVLPFRRDKRKPGPWMYEEWLWNLRRRYRKVVPSVEYAAKDLGVSCSTIRRWRAALRAAGRTLGVYNGGRGRRCIEYVGARAVERALAENPAWPVNSRLGGLRMGAVVRGKRGRKDLKNEILKASPSSRLERGTPSESPPSEIVRPDAPVADRDAPPEVTETRPPAGGSMPTDAPSAASAEVVHGWRPAIPVEVLGQHRPPPAPETLRAPQSPASGRQLPTGERTASRRDDARRTSSIAKKRPDLWRLAWSLWRAYSAHVRGGPPKDHPTDVGALKSILNRALLRFRGNEDRALDDIAWGMREFIADRDPDRRFKILANLCRYREDYGRAPETFRAPTRAEHATITPHKPTAAAVARLIRTTAEGGGVDVRIPGAGPPAPSTNLRGNLGFVDPRCAHKDSPRQELSAPPPNPVEQGASPAGREKAGFPSGAVSNNRDSAAATPARREIATWRNMIEFLRKQPKQNPETLAQIQRAEAKIAAILSAESAKVPSASSRDRFDEVPSARRDIRPEGAPYGGGETEEDD